MQKDILDEGAQDQPSENMLHVHADTTLLGDIVQNNLGDTVVRLHYGMGNTSAKIKLYNSTLLLYWG